MRYRTRQTKEVEYTVGNGEFTLFGALISEDANDFFFPLFSKLKLIVEGKRDLIFNFKFDYYNTSATRYISKIIKLMEKLSETNNVAVNWFYFEDDEIIQELGEMYKEISKINIRLIKHI